jgi:hypothetical protein
MIRLFKIILVCLVASVVGNVTLSQEMFVRLEENHTESDTSVISLSANLSPYQVIFTATEDTITWNITYHLTFTPIQGHKTVQALNDTVPGGTIALSCVFVDLSFDGYKDVRLQESVGARGGRTFHNWIFTPNDFVFRLNESFAEIPDDITLDSLNKTISFSGYTITDSRRDYSDATYKVIDGNAQLYEVVFTQEIEHRGKIRVKRRVERWDGTSMKVIEQTDKLTDMDWYHD